MRKHAQKKRSSVPRDPYEPVPQANRTQQKLDSYTAAWLAKSSSNKTPHGPTFIAWMRSLIEQNRQSLWELFHRYGLQPALVLDELASAKTNFLSREQLESDLWLTGMGAIVKNGARLGLPDNGWEKIRRNKRLREKHATILDKAAMVLAEYPGYFVVFLGVDMDEVTFDLPKYIKAIAAQMRQDVRLAKHRPREEAARMVLIRLTDTFKLAVGKPLYHYAGLLTKASFPEEWNPAGDIREAAKKLIKSYDAKLRRAGEEAGL